MTINERTAIGEIAAAVPSSVRVFQRHGIDFCCGGKRALGEVCNEQGLSLAETVAEIETSARQAADDHDWTTEPLAKLTEHIVAAYHDPLREELPRLQAMAAKVARVHGARRSYLARISEIVDLLTDDLLSHMGKEEAMLFPTIRAAEKGTADAAWVAAPISAMEREHDHAGVLLEDLRRLTNGYVAPEWGCATVRALYSGLEELDATMHVHVHLENNVLFPRARRHAERATATA